VLRLIAKNRRPDLTNWLSSNCGRRVSGALRERRRAITVWGPGAGAEAAGRLCPSHNRQGSQAYLSVAARSQGVSYTLNERQGPHQSPGSVRTNGMAGESAKAEETVTPPELTKDPRQRVQSTDVGAWGRMDGAQGVLAQPGWVRGCGLTSARRCAASAKKTNVERLIRCCGCREA